MIALFTVIYETAAVENLVFMEDNNPFGAISETSLIVENRVE
jgi:hypothetical protein